MAEPAMALGACMEALGAAAAQPERFLSVQEGLASDFTLLTKTLYDFHKALGADVLSGSPLKELVIDNVDEEHIWQQLELQNNAVLGYFKKAVARNVKEEQELFLLPELEEDGSVTGDSEKQTDSEEELEGNEDQSAEVLDHKSDHLEEECELGKRRTQRRTTEGTEEAFSDEDSDMDFDIDKFEQQSQIAKSTMKKRGEPSILDDRFFKLSEMEAVLDAAEKMENKERDEDDGIDYFDDVLSEDEDEEEEFGEANMKLSKSARDLKYQDYFDPVDDPEDFVSEHKDERSEGADSGTEYSSGAADETEEMDGIEQAQMEKNKELSKRVTFALPYDSDMEEDTDTFQGKADSAPETKSSFEKRQEKMGAKIKSLEEELLMEKPWQLKGEVTGQKRPENSLLEETLLFDHAVRMAPVITEETTLELEDIIKRRIKDQAWDDVVRKERAKEEPYEYKKRLTLDHEKSKQSLAEIYEQEYLKLNQKKSDEEEKPEHTEIQKMMDSLFLKLDALSNFHFTPKPPVPEVKIVSNLPAITMEEVAPVSVSDAALLAPEEIKEKNKGGDIKTDAEKTSTDKKRERRKKKLAKRMRLKEREKRQKLLEQKSEQGAKLSKKVSAGQLKKLTKDGRTSLLKDDGKDKALKSSKAFFSQLQDQVKMQIKDAKKSQKKPRKRELSAQKLKL
ncbi:U3 small nucleolar ribonucleoprotein MPP10 [Varanus komodoensis]|uniref:U3 small nucleolar ribonucleoprotein protein MPP10 n=1 Tax=Varanus komodoensis TaxID=61221 RepID=A0A8D2L0Q3_VARKO|nr:U3 small nucleolar ribonucleoprotein protein MPP10 [Varanus komodoensis]KAF7241588.1 U3 small nucleolar ribonucleoprotein MPP10 [Varanus komodoensis]